jgi:SAM-dependent methyltransferase
MQLTDKLNAIRHSKNVYPGEENDSILKLLMLVAYRSSRSRLVEAYRRRTKSSIFHLESELWMCSLLPEKTLNIVLRETAPKSVLDVGCGTGLALHFFIPHGADGVGIEGSKLAIDKSPCADKIMLADLNKPIDLGRKFDLVWCNEVIEHIHPTFEAIFVDTLVKHASRYIVLSGAQPGQGGAGHFNEQKPEYWISRFTAKNMVYVDSITKLLHETGEPFCTNMLVFKTA